MRFISALNQNLPFKSKHRRGRSPWSAPIFHMEIVGGSFKLLGVTFAYIILFFAEEFHTLADRSLAKRDAGGIWSL